LHGLTGEKLCFSFIFLLCLLILLFLLRLLLHTASRPACQRVRVLCRRTSLSSHSGQTRDFGTRDTSSAPAFGALDKKNRRSLCSVRRRL